MLDRLLYALRRWRGRSRLDADGVPYRATDIMLADGTGWPAVTRSSHPVLFEALETLSHDSGSGAGRPEYRVPPWYQSLLPWMDESLAAMKAEVRYAFVLPVNDQVAKVAQAEPGAAIVNAFLGDFLDGFPGRANDWAAHLHFNPTPGDATGDDEDAPNLILPLPGCDGRYGGEA